MLEYLRIIVDARIERDEEGATAVEYGLMVAMIAIAIITAVLLLGFRLDEVFDSVASKV